MMSKRKLTSGEIKLAKRLFGRSIDYTNITIYDRRLLPPGLQEKNIPMCTGKRMSFPSTTYSEDFSKTKDINKQSVFIHEMFHVWQDQNKVVNLTKEALRETVKHKFNYLKAYPYTLEKNKDLTSYGFEQQAAIVQDYFLRSQHGQTTSYKNRCQNTETGKDLDELYGSVLKNFLYNPSYTQKGLPNSKHRHNKPFK